MYLGHRLPRTLCLTLALVGSLAAQKPGIGKPAPSFTCSDQAGNPVTFPPQGQWAVLAFYPRAATPG